ncbi:hypothetical protein BC936DRAFT_145362 [Jimgerdemannia flammicorona]|uniref:Uncharacterized protein n=1 Tax=Jimgerdemannia flammicorona TaxID=994334 RepID=A0A433DA61_9FUNG|nr:hypothetical protein BC936DRAFT_145362 [Jimgerdemannia flammicorona]
MVPTDNITCNEPSPALHRWPLRGARYRFTWDSEIRDGTGRDATGHDGMRWDATGPEYFFPNRVHATSGSDEKAKLTESLGVTTGSTTKSALELKVNKGVDIIIDFVGKDYPGGVGHGRVPVVLELIVTYFYVAVSNLLRHVDRIVVEKFDLSILWEKRLMVSLDPPDHAFHDLALPV